MKMADHPRYHALDAMRGIAALGVVVFHIGGELHQRLFPHAYLAVDFFFMLSGFVLARAYESRLKGPLSASRFLEMRLIRLYPLFALGVLFGAARVASHSTFLGAIAAFVMNALMLPAISSPDHLFPFNLPAWSLFFELLINILFGLAIWRMPSHRLAAVCAVAGALFLLGILKSGHADLGMFWSNAGYGLFRVSFSFCLGVVLARVLPAGRRRSPLALLPLAALGLLLAAPWPVAFGAQYDAIAIFLVMPVLLWLGARSELPAPLQPAGAVLGDVSYPLYAIHFPLLQIFSHVVIRTLHLPAFVAGTLFLIGAVWLSWFLAHRFDAPVRRWLSGRVRSRAMAMPVGP